MDFYPEGSQRDEQTGRQAGTQGSIGPKHSKTNGGLFRDYESETAAYWSGQS